MEDPPNWVEVIDTRDVRPFAGLHKGESAAIALAQSIQADLLLIEEREVVKVACDKVVDRLEPELAGVSH